MAFRANRAAKLQDANSIHDLRVTIRRFAQCLRVFRQFFPAGATKKIRRQLRLVLDLAAEVRNRDIAIDLWKEAKMPPAAGAVTRLGQERRQSRKELVSQLERLSRREFSR